MAASAMVALAAHGRKEQSAPDCHGVVSVRPSASSPRPRSGFGSGLAVRRPSAIERHACVGRPATHLGLDSSQPADPRRHASHGAREARRPDQAREPHARPKAGPSPAGGEASAANATPGCRPSASRRRCTPGGRARSRPGAPGRAVHARRASRDRHPRRDRRRADTTTRAPPDHHHPPARTGVAAATAPLACAFRTLR